MAVEIVAFNPDWSLEVRHTEAGHGGTVPLASLSFVTNPDGTPNYHYFRLPCPACSSISVHPIGGGCQPFAIQMQFARTYQRIAPQLGIPPEKRDWASIVALVCELVDQMDFPGRCVIGHTTGPNDTTPPGGTV